MLADAPMQVDKGDDSGKHASQVTEESSDDDSRSLHGQGDRKVRSKVAGAQEEEGSGDRDSDSEPEVKITKEQPPVG